MRRLVILIFLSLAIINTSFPKDMNVTIKAVNRPAAEVFRTLVQKTGKNFVYSSELLKDLRVTVRAKDLPLDSVLSKMFDGSYVEYRIRGNDVILKRKKHGQLKEAKSNPLPLPASRLTLR